MVWLQSMSVFYTRYDLCLPRSSETWMEKKGKEKGPVGIKFFLTPPLAFLSPRFILSEILSL